MSKKKGNYDKFIEDWTFSVAKEGKWEKFKSNAKLRARLRNAIEDYNELVILQFKEKRASKHNIDFEVNVLLDHIEMILDYTLNPK